jgi:radical SAM protein with 4Fe4S-binding SPASM domain
MAIAPGREDEALRFVDGLVAETRAAVFVRREDNLLMIRPDKTLRLNRTAVEILAALYDRAAPGAARVLAALAPVLSTDPERLLEDTLELARTVAAVLREDFSPRPMLVRGRFERDLLRYPTLAEIALTYDCQNRCAFCYASSPHRGRSGDPGRPPMRTDEVKRVMERILHEAHIPSLSFTGGESTLRSDLCELVSFGRDLGLRVNLITNGGRASDEAFARELVRAGLASAQVSLEAGEAGLHDEIVGRRGAFDQAVRAVRHFQRLGIHVHTNTTLCAANSEAAPGLVRFAARELHEKTISMNMVIRTGSALTGRPTRVTYAEVASKIPGLLEVARAEGVKLVWYSPIPYCLFNPVLHGLGGKSCACVHGLLSVDPTGQVLPCSSFEGGLGSLLERPYAKIRASRAAAYWDRRGYLPPPCEGCPEADLCAGACPLYWDEAGSFAELPRPGAADPELFARWARRRERGRSYGAQPPAPEREDGDGPVAEGGF